MAGNACIGNMTLLISIYCIKFIQGLNTDYLIVQVLPLYDGTFHYVMGYSYHYGITIVGRLEFNLSLLQGFEDACTCSQKGAFNMLLYWEDRLLSSSRKILSIYHHCYTLRLSITDTFITIIITMSYLFISCY